MATYKIYDDGEWVPLAQGPRGVQGPQGPAGVGLSIQGELDSTNDLPAVGDPGDAWLIDGDLWAWGEENQTWSNAGPVGTPGEPGAPGEPGTTDYNELDNKPTLGGAAALNVGTTTGTVAAGDDSRLTNSRTPTSHGNEAHSSTFVDAAGAAAAAPVQSVASKTGAVTLANTDISGLGGAAVLNVGTTAGTVAAGDDSRITGAVAASTLTTNGDVLTRAAGVPARITRADLAADTAFTSAFAAISGQYAVNVVAASGATETLPATHSAHRVTMDEACEFTFTNPTAAGHTFMLLLSGAFVPTFPASVDWSGGAPTYATPSLFVFTTMNTGTDWLGSLVGSGFA
jgi:hypothetical protein